LQTIYWELNLELVQYFSYLY